MRNRALDDKRPQVERMIRFPSPLYQRLRIRAEAEHRSINAQVLVAIQEQLEREAV